MITVRIITWCENPWIFLIYKNVPMGANKSACHWRNAQVRNLWPMTTLSARMRPQPKPHNNINWSGIIWTDYLKERAVYAKGFGISNSKIPFETEKKSGQGSRLNHTHDTGIYPHLVSSHRRNEKYRLRASWRHFVLHSDNDHHLNQCLD